MAKQLLFVPLVILLGAPLAYADIFTIDPIHSQIHFTVPHLMIFKLRGEFTDYAGTIDADPVKVKIRSVTTTIRTASLDTREAQRDAQLRSRDFFDVVNHPQMSFTTTSIDGPSEDLRITGNLTIRGTTRPVVIRGKYLGLNTDRWGNVRASFEGTTTITRQDYGLSWNKALNSVDYVVGNQVEIGLEIEAIRQL